MFKMPAGNLPDFQCKSLNMHCIFSFLCGWENDGELITPASPHSIASTAQDTSSPQHDCFVFGKPEEREGLAPYLQFENESLFYRFRQEKALFTNQESNFDATIDRLARISPLGSSLTVSLSVQGHTEKPIGIDTIRGAYSLINARRKEASAQVTDAPFSHYQLNRDSGPVSIDHIAQNAMLSILHTAKHKNTQDKMAMADGYLERPKINEGAHTLALVGQSPWIINVAEVDGKLADIFCSDFNELGGREAKKTILAHYRRELAPILFRGVSEEFPIDPAFGAEFENINLDSRLFINMSRRSILCICQNKQKDPALYFLPGLIDMCEIIRARWHTLVVLNKKLDAVSTELLRRSKLESDKKASSYADKTSGLVGHMIDLREWLSLALQDPGVYLFSGEALSRIYDNLQQSYKLNELTTLVQHKMDHLNQLYRDTAELQWIEK